MTGRVLFGTIEITTYQHKELVVCACNSPYISKSFDPNDPTYISLVANFDFLIIVLPLQIFLNLHLLGNHFYFLYHY